MNPAVRRRRARPGPVLVAAVLTGLTLGGCTSGDDEPPAAAPATATPRPDATAGTAGPDAPDGPTPQELSADLLASAARTQEPLGAVTSEVLYESGKTTLEVLEVRAVEGATFVVLRLTADGEAYNVGPTTFADGRFGTQSFVRDIYLDDVAGGTRYLPLQFEDYRKACVCPYKPLELGPVPQVVTALFPALPDGTSTVSVSLAGTELELTGLPVG